MKATKIITMLVACSLCAGTAMAKTTTPKPPKPPPVDEFKKEKKKYMEKLKLK